MAAIKNALKQENLNPEIEEKLLQLQRYQERQMKQEPITTTAAMTEVSSSPVLAPRVNRSTTSNSRVYANKRPQSATQKVDDTEWQGETPKRKVVNKIEFKKEESRYDISS